MIQDLNTNGFPYFIGLERQFSILSEKNDREKLVKEILFFSDGKIVINKFWTFKEDDGQWKVLSLVE
ncbi:hypothetical protein BBI01_06785 [Chryseobacterium artocarpi]|uniref:Uncharacterized protein n=1 Tax=Chryseobacterium artocarpi TaxID=1414727 RepID=A0A1B8ZXS1_9FLAO|nr:hypothetical protein BBI01_06785 [Chryseobacterium artocarpi]